MKRFLKVLIGFIVVLILAIMTIFNLAQFGQNPKGERLERIKKSPNYVDGEFRNFSETPVISSDKSQFSVMWDFAFSKKVNVTPTDSIQTVQTKIKELDPNENVMVWFGHSSYYIQLNGKRFLIDPVFSGYASPFSFANKAFKGTDVYKSEDFPEIDYLIISHDHYDHLDYHTVLELKDRIKHVVCGLGIGQHFEYWGYDTSKITELDWHDGIELGDGMSLTATPARHYSGRGLKRNQTLWASYVLKADDYKVYIGGDSGHDSFFKEIGDQYGPFDMVILEQGQYNKDWSYIHLLPEEVFQTASELKGSKIFPVHNSKFALAVHPWNEPLNEITKGDHDIPVITPKIGEVVYLSSNSQVFEQWW